MPEWVVEHGIGETRAALIENDGIVEARVRREGVIAAGTILEGRLAAVAPRLTVEAGGEQFLLPRGASGINEGRSLRIRVVREALGGGEPWKRGLARLTDEPLSPAPELADGREGIIAGWDDLIEEARGGIVGFQGGELRIEPTAAMTMIDVDGWLVPDRLGQMGAWAAALAIRRLDIGGPVGIDFPTLRDKADRRAVDDIFDQFLPQRFEKTAMNGFGFVQVVRPRERPSLIDLAADRAPFEARALLRRAGREVGAIRLVAHPAIVRILEARGDWIDRLARQVGGVVGLHGQPNLPLSGGYAERF